MRRHAQIRARYKERNEESTKMSWYLSNIAKYYLSKVILGGFVYDAKMYAHKIRNNKKIMKEDKTKMKKKLSEDFKDNTLLFNKMSNISSMLRKRFNDKEFAKKIQLKNTIKKFKKKQIILKSNEGI